MSTPIQGDKSLTLNSDLNQSSSTNKGGTGTTGTSSQSAAPIEAVQPSAEIDIERGSQVYSSSTRQTQASSNTSIHSTEEANSRLEQLAEQLANNPSQAMQAQGHITTDQVEALLNAA